MKLFTSLLTAVLFVLLTSNAFAGLRFINSSGALVGQFDTVACGSGMSCAQSGSQLALSQGSTQKSVVVPLYGAKVGGTAGFVVNAASNALLATIPQSQTGSVLIVPLPPMRIGTVINGYSLQGFLASAGNAGTFDADLRSQTAAAGSITDASAGAMTQLSVTANTAVTSANAAKTGLSVTVAEGVTYYLKITSTTGSSVTGAISGVELLATGL